MVLPVFQRLTFCDLLCLLRQCHIGIRIESVFQGLPDEMFICFIQYPRIHFQRILSGAGI